MKISLINTLRKFQNIGLTEKDTHFNTIRIRIYNSLLLLTILFQSVIFFAELFEFDLMGFLIISSHLTFTSSLVFLNKFKKTRLSIIIFNIVYPLMNFLLVFVYQEPNNIEYTFVIFLISIFLLQQGLLERLLLAALPFSYLIYAKSGHKYVGYIGKELDYMTDTIVLVTAVFTILITLLSLAWELKKYDERIRKLLIEVDTKNEELMDKNKELERFSYIVSHDMKTPLRAVAGYISILERKLVTENEENLKYLRYIKENTIQLNNLVVQTLEFSKIDNHEIKLEPIDVNEILFKLSRDFITKNIQVFTETFPMVLGNKVFVNKIFQNLIENGGKYNNSEEKIINISSEIKGTKVIFAIKDNGIGIEEKFHEQIFEMYKRLHTKKEYSGTGLGLSICKKIAKQLNGDITLESQLGKGSTFYLELELAD